MKRLRISAVGNENIITSIVFGVLSALIISIVLTIGQTSLIANGKINENGSVGIFLIRAIATAVGSLVGSALSGKKFLHTILIITGAYFVILLGIGGVLFDGEFYKLWMGVLSAVLGAAVALAIKLKPQTTRRKVPRFNK